MISSKNSLPNKAPCSRISSRSVESPQSNVTKAHIGAKLVLAALLFAMPGCSTIQDSDIAVTEQVPVKVPDLLLAVFPLHNISGTPAPLRDIKHAIIQSLDNRGVHSVQEEILETFLADHRIRYVGGIDDITAQILRQALGVHAVLITSLELYSDRPPPKIALTSRLVSTGEDMAVWWMDGVGLAGDDHPGLLELSLIEDPKKLLDNAVAHLSDSLWRRLSETDVEGHEGKRRNRFRPRFVHEDSAIVAGKAYDVAVTPFFNVSERKNGEEIMALHFLMGMRKLEGFTVLEPGRIRQALLGLRVIMEDGLSLAYADLLFGKLDVDFILTGKVLSYEDYQGPWGKPKVDFSALLIEKKSRKIVWTCKSRNEGDEGVFFFDVGKVNTAHALASEMVGLALDTLGKAGE